MIRFFGHDFKVMNPIRILYEPNLKYINVHGAHTFRL